MGAAAPLMGAYMLYQRHEKRRAESSARGEREEAHRTWEETAFPSAEVMAAKKGELSEARGSAYENLARNLSTRGFGPGSGLMKRGAGGIEKGHLLGQTELTKFQHSPMFAPPSGMYPSGMQPYGDDPLGQAFGMMMAWSMLKGGGGFGGGGGSTPDYGIDPNAHWPGLDF